VEIELKSFELKLNLLEVLGSLPLRLQFIDLLAGFRAAFTAWLLMNILLMVVPRYGAYTMVLTGLLVLSADLMYLWLLPDAPLQVRFEVGMLKFELGWCFWLTLIAGTNINTYTSHTPINNLLCESRKFLPTLNC